MKIQCVATVKEQPLVDRNHKPICVGDKVRAQICVGIYGQTKIVEGIIKDRHWLYCGTYIDRTYVQVNPYNEGDEFIRGQHPIVCYYRHNDWEHFHEAWIEVIEEAK